MQSIKPRKPRKALVRLLNRRTDLIGVRIGKLTVLRPGPVVGVVKRSFWECSCTCGNTINVRESLLVNYGKPGNRRAQLSCGCLQGQHVTTSATEEIALLRDKWGKAQVWRFYQYSAGASQRGLCFNVTEHDFERLCKSACHYCGEPPSNTAKVPQRCKGTARAADFIYNGLDRVDNDKGYTLDNVVSCCKTCNFAKRTNTYEGFLGWIAKVYHRMYGSGAKGVTPGDLLAVKGA
jgi:hypothetical protein